MASKKAKSSAKPNTNKLPGCTSLHKDYNTVIDLITNIYLSTGKCTPTQFQTKYPKVFNKFNPDSVKGLIYRVKKNLQKQTYNADPPPGKDPSATPASNDKDKKKSHSSDDLDPSGDEEENDANSFSEEEEVSGSDSDSDGDSDSDSDSDISMGSSPASSAKKERRKKSKPFILFHSI